MNRISIGEAFASVFAVAKENWGKILLYMLGGVAVCLALGALLIGSIFAQMAGGPPDPQMIAGQFGSIFLFFLLVLVIMSAVGMLIARACLHPGESPPVGWALQAGPAYSFGLMVLFIMIYIVMIIVIGILAVVVGGAAMGAGSFSPDALRDGSIAPGLIVLFVIFYIVFVLALLWMQVRIMLAVPVMADQLTRNPITGIGRSWTLTGPSQWSLLGFYIVFTIASTAYVLILSLVLTPLMAGGSSAMAGIGGLVMLLLVYVPLLVFSAAIPIGIYRAIAGPGHSTADTFA